MSTAYADESMRTLGGESMYLIGATVFSDDCPQLNSLIELKGKGAQKLHWRELGREKQIKVMRAVSSIPAITTVVIGTPLNPRKQERARRKCLEALIWTLDHDDVNVLVLEGRDSALNKRDIQLVDALKSRGQRTKLVVQHKEGSEEPRLWVPDQVLGAYGDQLCLDRLDTSWLDAWRTLEEHTRLQIIDL
ncbi:MAG: hypothetical protein IKG22_10995 [Atopobiaceae bacterium]|nr:hypothetical protein [Atopobiaceae bacterium]